MKELFPAQQGDVLYLTEGGTETEVMYKCGFELPQRAGGLVQTGAQPAAKCRKDGQNRPV
jgi:hypothetical protein